MELLSTENEILKAKISDLETRVNTMSRAGDDTRLEEKFRFEKVITSINDDNRLISEKYRINQLQIIKYEEEI